MCGLTVKLRGRTTTPDRGRGPAISTGSRGPKQMTHHGPLQRLLGGRTVLYPHGLARVMLHDRVECFVNDITRCISKRIDEATNFNAFTAVAVVLGIGYRVGSKPHGAAE